MIPERFVSFCANKQLKAPRPLQQCYSAARIEIRDNNGGNAISSATSFIYAIVPTEILSLVICLILLMGSVLGTNSKTRRTRWYIALASAVMLGCLCDALSWILDGHAELISILIITTIGSMVMTMVTMGIFYSYLFAYVRERAPISKVPNIFGWVLVVIGIVVVIIACITGNLYVFENGSYSNGPLYSIYVVANASYIVIGIITIVAYRKTLDFYDRLATCAYMLLPMIAAISSIAVDGWNFTYPAISLSLLILYVMLQSDRVKKLEKEGTIISYQATHDELTGLNNRNAYQRRTQLLASSDEFSGVVFGDLNGLKITNDSLGHEAGDQMLVRFAEMLTSVFRADEVYRISGDEFVCIIESVSKEAFSRRARELENILNQQDPPLACVGTSYGSGKDIESVVKDAEAKMYVAKNAVHERFPEMNR